MRYLSVIRDDEILDQIPLPEGLKDEQVIDIDQLLRSAGILTDTEEIAVTEDM